MRRPRLQFPGSIHHVIVRGNQRQNVFWDPGDYIRYLTIAARDLDSRGFAILAYCLMTNHVHLLIEQKTGYPLSKYMQRLQLSYTTFFNRKHHKQGHLFQGRYKAVLVDKDGYLLALVKYIHLNPVEAKMVRNPADYRWSSHRQYLRQEKDPTLKVTTELVFEMLGTARSTARLAYLDLMGVADDNLADKVMETRHGVVLGDELFERQAYRRVGRDGDRPRKIECSIEKIWTRILRRDGFNREPDGWVRSRLMAEVALLAQDLTDIPQRELANFFNVDQSTISMAIRTLRKRWSKDPGGAAKYESWVRQF